MGIFEEKGKLKGGYIFLSHSHDDIEKVRRIRNILEQDGFEPLCFYLKCLEDENEIAELIKREIDAREWFVFVNSENARQSRWVNLEREYIGQTNSKKIFTIDLDREASVEEAVHKIRHNLRIFLSYSHRDRLLAEKFTRRLQLKDYLVFFDQNSIMQADHYVEHIANAIQQASREGCVVALITENALHSRSVMREIMFAMENGGNVVPVIVDGCDLMAEPTLKFYLMGRQCYPLSSDAGDAEMDRIIDAIGKNIVSGQ